MWSMMRRPGERRTEIAAAWAARLVTPCDDSMNLQLYISIEIKQIKTCLNTQLQSIYKHQFGGDDGKPLEIYCLPAVVLQIVDPKHSWVNQLGYLRKNPFEICEERRIVKSPF